jgi:hypothetical protein
MLQLSRLRPAVQPQAFCCWPVARRRPAGRRPQPIAAPPCPQVGLKTRVQTPQLLADVTIPDHATVMGVRVDLAPLQKLVSAGSSGLAAAGKLVQGVVSPEVGGCLLPGARHWRELRSAHACTRCSQPCNARPLAAGRALHCSSTAAPAAVLQVPVAGLASDRLSMWMTTTYLDGGLRVARDEAGKVYVMLKDGGEMREASCEEL